MLITTLPAGYRPCSRVIAVNANVGQAGSNTNIVVNTNGQINVELGTNTGYIFTYFEYDAFN
jgi:hypothetical protein